MVKPTPPRRPKGAAQPRPNTDEPVFAQPQPSPDPTSFKNPVRDQNYTEIANLEPVPQPVGGAAEPILTLAQTYGSAGDAKVTAIQQAKQIVFHSVGDTGSVIGPDTQSLVADKMVSDFDEANSADLPSFFFHLGDVVYYFRRPLSRFQAITTAWSMQRIHRLHSRPFCVTSAPPAPRHPPMRERWCARR